MAARAWCRSGASRTRRRAGPSGGDGGSGGDVYFLADRNVASLLAFRDHPHRRAPSGKHGAGKEKHGASGEDLVVAVPEGTIVRARDGELARRPRAPRRQVPRGARRPRRAGNARFLSNARRAPGFAEQGEYGEELWLRLEVKLLADAALVGFPNSGKSTLISAVSAAKPKIADYPFTTLEPHLGVVRFRDHEFVLADIPGLIEGAAEGRGLGHTFLRHVERARVLVLLLDLASVEERSPEEQERILLDELEQYRPELLERPRLVVGSKADVATSELHDPDAHHVVGGHACRARRVPRSSREPRRRARAPRSPTSTSPSSRCARSRRGSPWCATTTARGASPGRTAERVVAMADLTNEEAIEYVQVRLRRMGVERALARAGAREGDVVRVGPVELEYQEGFT